eukprot:191846_1
MADNTCNCIQNGLIHCACQFLKICDMQLHPMTAVIWNIRSKQMGNSSKRFINQQRYKLFCDRFKSNQNCGRTTSLGIYMMVENSESAEFAAIRNIRPKITIMHDMSTVVTTGENESEPTSLNNPIECAYAVIDNDNFVKAFKCDQIPANKQLQTEALQLINDEYRVDYIGAEKYHECVILDFETTTIETSELRELWFNSMYKYKIKSNNNDELISCCFIDLKVKNMWVTHQFYAWQKGYALTFVDHQSPKQYRPNFLEFFNNTEKKYMMKQLVVLPLNEIIIYRNCELINSTSWCAEYISIQAHNHALLEYFCQGNGIDLIEQIWHIQRKRLQLIELFENNCFDKWSYKNIINSLKQYKNDTRCHYEVLFEPIYKYYNVERIMSCRGQGKHMYSQNHNRKTEVQLLLTNENKLYSSTLISESDSEYLINNQTSTSSTALIQKCKNIEINITIIAGEKFISQANADKNSPFKSECTTQISDKCGHFFYPWNKITNTVKNNQLRGFTILSRSINEKLDLMPLQWAAKRFLINNGRTVDGFFYALHTPTIDISIKKDIKLLQIASNNMNNSNQNIDNNNIINENHVVDRPNVIIQIDESQLTQSQVFDVADKNDNFTSKCHDEYVARLQEMTNISLLVSEFAEKHDIAHFETALFALLSELQTSNSDIIDIDKYRSNIKKKWNKFQRMSKKYCIKDYEIFG